MNLQIQISPTKKLSGEYFDSNFLSQKFDKLSSIAKDPVNSFFHEYNSTNLLNQVHETVKKFKNKKTIVHIGIGGSSLGPEMLIKAIGIKNDRKFIFINNIDPEEIHDQLKGLDIENSLFSFVSKSGSTIETIAGLNIILSQLKKNNISEDRLKDFLVFTTDPKKSQLKDLAEEFEITTLDIPSAIGGRFSVLTPVGLLPAAFAGISVEDIIKGAEEIKDHILSPGQENELIKMASFLMSLKKEGITQTVLMPYSSKLRDFSLWFTQLWAESLGKKYGLNQKIINTGLTPIPAYGATDQHSQVQLFMEGPYDKCLILIEVEHFRNDFSLKDFFPIESSQNLAPFHLSEIMKAQLEGTSKALEENNRPYIRMKIPEINERSMASLILWFESLTALMGDYLEINPFDQPGVEHGKKFAQEWLKSNES